MLQPRVVLVHRCGRVRVLQSIVELSGGGQGGSVYGVYLCLLLEGEDSGLGAALELVLVLDYLYQLRRDLQALVAPALLEQNLGQEYKRLHVQWLGRQQPLQNSDGGLEVWLFLEDVVFDLLKLLLVRLLLDVCNNRSHVVITIYVSAVSCRNCHFPLCEVCRQLNGLRRPHGGKLLGFGLLHRCFALLFFAQLVFNVFYILFLLLPHTLAVLKFPFHVRHVRVMLRLCFGLALFFLLRAHVLLVLEK